MQRSALTPTMVFTYYRCSLVLSWPTTRCAQMSTSQGERENESEELEEAVSQPCDSSDEDLSEESVSPKGKPTHGPASRGAVGAQGLDDMGEARGAQSKGGGDLEDDYDIDGEDNEEEHVGSQDCDVEEEDSMMLSECL